VKQYRHWEKQNRPWDSQLIIGMSAHANMTDSRMWLQAGMNACYPKPITIKTITDLEKSSEAVMRTRQLNELESTMGPTSVVDSKQPAIDFQSSMYGNSSATVINQVTGQLREPAIPAPVCLIATDVQAMQTNLLTQQLESMGWKAVVVNDGADCLRLLQMRNWDAVFIDDDLPQLSGASCITEFRKWEEHTRVIGQKNVFLVCEGDIPPSSAINSWIQPPKGYNGVLRKKATINDLQCLLHVNGASDSMVVVAR
jgi:CheY-like chemotaxis protein